MCSKVTIVIHAGAYNIPEQLIPPGKEGSEAAALAGWKVLKSGGSALDAVQAATIVLEDYPTFNAGTGGSLTSEETVELDAFIMNGQDLKVGAVTGVNCVKNPIKLCRAIMDETDHCLFSGEGGNKLAQEFGMEIVDPKSLATEESYRRFNEYKTFMNTVQSGLGVRDGEGSKIKREYDTVGAIALDQYGHLAAATSTGGLTGKMVGRIGDSPLTGCGGYADDEKGAVSTTGHGEGIMRSCLAYDCLSRMTLGGLLPKEAAYDSLKHLQDRIQSAAGLIVLNPHGEVTVEFTTEKMVWAYIQEDVLHQGVLPGEHITKSL